MGYTRQLTALILGVTVVSLGTPVFADQEIAISPDGNNVPAFSNPSTYCHYLDVVAANGGLAPATQSGTNGWIGLKSGQQVSVTGNIATATCYGRVVQFRRITISGHAGVWFVMARNLHKSANG
jgi:hypothetical protein